MLIAHKIEEMTKSGFQNMPKAVADVLTTGIEELRASGIVARALSVGDVLPVTRLTSADGGEVDLKDIMKTDYLVLNFYRGGWCPYCNIELRAYEALRSQFRAASSDIIAVSPERPLYAAQTIEKNSLSFPTLTDDQMVMARGLGIAFRLNDDLSREYQNFGIDLQELNGSEAPELLLPAVYVVDRQMKIMYAHLEADHMLRIEPLEVLGAVQDFYKGV